MTAAEQYLPALKWHVCTGWYGFICSISGLGAGFKYHILETVRLRGAERVADIGCGTGTLLNVLARRYPHVKGYGIDPDSGLLAHARRQVCVAKGRVLLEQGVAQAIPQPANCFDVVFCTLTLHHLPDADKTQALAEMFRILKPGGRIVITDFFQRYRWWPGVFLFENRSYIKSCLEGKMPAFLREAGFERLTFFAERPFIAIAVGYKPYV